MTLKKPIPVFSARKFLEPHLNKNRAAISIWLLFISLVVVLKNESLDGPTSRLGSGSDLLFKEDGKIKAASVKRFFSQPQGSGK